MPEHLSFPVRPFVGPSRVLFGAGAAESVGSELTAAGVAADNGIVLVVADAALTDLGLLGPVVSALEATGFDVHVAPGVQREPTPDTITSAVATATGDPVAAVVGIGGGSAVDASKLVAASLTNGVDLTAGMAPTATLAPVPMLVAVPTTAGTGAEATAVAMLWHEQRKRIFVHDRLVPRIAILDPSLMRSLPAPIIAASGLDAISHAIESRLSTFRTPMTAEAGAAALRRLAPALPRAVTEPELDDLAALILGAHEAGMALNASVVSGHSMAYAIAARTGLSHGVTCAMALPYCLAYSRAGAEREIAELAPIAGCGDSSDAVLRWVIELTESLGLPPSLEAVGLSTADLAGMAADVVEQYPRPNSPVPLEAERLERLLSYFHAGDAQGAWAAFSAPTTSEAVR